MTTLITFKKTFLLLLITAFTVLTSCASDDSSDVQTNPSVIGKWHNYKRVEKGKTYTDNGADPISNLNYEFQTNACIIVENGDVTNYIYKVDGDYIKFYNPKTEVLKFSERIISLNKEELVLLNNDNNSEELMYFSKI